MHTPYFRVRQVGKQILTDGTTACSLGHKIEYSGHKNPDGIFAEWSWDGNRLLVRNDRYGIYPLYYFSRPGELALSTSIPKLVTLGAPVILDEAALAVFLRLGFFIGEDTPFRAIKAIPPSATFEWQNGELRVSGAWPLAKANRISRSSAIDAYISLFRNSIQRRILNDNNSAIALSGGRDSRHILLELCASGYPPRLCVTARAFPPAPSPDAKIANQLATALDLHHIVLDQTKSRLRTDLRKNLITNFCTDEFTWYLVIADYFRGRTNAVYDGMAGDILSAGLFLTRERLDLFEAGNLSDLAQNLFFRHAGERSWRQLLGKRYYRFSLELAISHLSDELKRHAEAPNPVGSFYLANRIRREIGPSAYCLLTEVGTVFSPYLDHELYDFLASLPASMLLDYNFHSDTIRRAYPHYSDIPYAARWDPVLHNWRFALELMRYAYLNHPPQFVSSSYLLPRLLRNVVDKSYEARFGPLIVYLIQLERFCRMNEMHSE